MPSADDYQDILVEELNIGDGAMILPFGFFESVEGRLEDFRLNHQGKREPVFRIKGDPLDRLVTSSFIQPLKSIK